MEILILKNQISIMNVLKRLTSTSEADVRELEIQIKFTRARINALK